MKVENVFLGKEFSLEQGFSY